MLAMDSSTVIGTGMPFSSRGPNKLLISWPLSYGESVQYGRTAPALLAFTLRAGLKAFAMQLGAAVAVVFEQRDGVVDLFLYGERPCAYPTVADGKTRLLEEILFSTPPARTLREPNRRRRANLFAASAENAASEVELPRQLVGGQIGLHRQGVRRTGVNAGGAADALLRIMLRFAAEVLSTGIGSSGYECVAVPVLMTF